MFHYIIIIIIIILFIGRSMCFTILTLPTMLRLFTSLTLLTIVIYIFFKLITSWHILHYKYKILTLKAYNLQHSINIDLLLDTVLNYDYRLQNAILPT